MNLQPPTTNVPAGSESAASARRLVRRGPPPPSPPRRSGSSGVVSLTISDIIGGSANEPPAEPPENGNDNNSNSSFDRGVGGMFKMKQMKMNRPTVAAKGKSLRNIMSGLNRVKSRRGVKFADIDEDGREEKGGFLSEAEGGGGGGASVKSGRGGNNINRHKHSLSKVSSLTKGASLRNITGKMNKNSEEKKTLADLIERQSWRKVRSRVKSEEGRREVVASLLTGGASTTPVPSVSNNISGDGTEGRSLPSKTVHKNTSANETEAADSNSGVKQKRGSKKQNVLHLAVRCRAPPSILISLLDVCPSLIVESDSLRGGTALHVAVSFEARPYRHGEDVVGFLLEANPSAVWARDNLGRLPLHLACISSDDLLEPSNNSATTANGAFSDEDNGDVFDYMNHIASDIMDMLRGALDARSVSALISRAPRALLVEDDRGYVPADYAAEAASSGADASCARTSAVLEGLLEECEMEWRERGLRRDKTKKRGGGGGASVTNDVDKDEIEDDSDADVEAEYERWLGRRTPCFRRALEKHQRRRERRGDDEDRRRANEEEAADRMMDMGIALFLGLAGDEGSSFDEEGGGADKHRGRENEAKDPEKRPCRHPAVPRCIAVDPQQGDEWLEDELEVESEGSKCDEAS